LYSLFSLDCLAMKTRLTLPRARLAMLVLAFGLLGSAFAEKADSTKPMNAEADSLRFDDVKQISVFTGNVVITKGSIVIRGDVVEVRQDNEGFQFGTARATGGKRAFYRQKRDTAAGAVEEWIEGEGEIISYDGKADVVTFSKNAVMRRLRGAVVADETTGAVISYNNTSDVFNVSGGVTASGAPAPGGRVRAVLSPRASASAPASSGAATPAANLRPSTTLGGEKK
jgi:lipopolysaccharide export system protein LptA